MKHLKKLSVVLMLTTLFSVTFTSCIDNEVSPVVEAIYEAQADLIAAQAGVQNAEASLLLAQANAAQAQAAYTTAQAAQVAAYTAGIIADNAYEALQRQQYLLELVAQTNLDVANAENALELAQVAFQTQMAAAIAAMEAAGVQLAVDYAYDYMWAMQHANGIMSDLLNAQQTLANAQLMQNGAVSWEFYLAQMQGNVATAMATKAGLQTAIAAMQAYIANPTTPEAVLSGLKTQKAAYEDAIVAKEIAMQVQFNKIMAIYDEDGVRDELVDRYEEALADHDAAVSDKEDREDWIADNEDDIAGWEADLADYPAALAALELAVSDAQDAVDAAQGVLDAANDDLDAANDVLTAAEDDLTDANTALSVLNAELALLNGTYYAAVTNLAAEQAAYDGGIVGVNAVLTAANLALTAGNSAVTLAQADYDAKQLAFELNPTGFVWTGGANGAVGLHADATTATNSYRNYDDTLNTMSALSLTPIGTNETGNYVTYAAYAIDAPSLGYNSYYNVGGDDVAGGTNAARLNAATLALTTAQNAIPFLQLAVTNAQFDVDHFGDDLADAEDVYDIQKNLYDNQLALVAAAEAVVDAADDAVTAAEDAVTAAEDAVTAAEDDLTAAEGDLTAAEGDLTAFEATTEAELQDWIDIALAEIADWTLEIAAIEPIIAAKLAVVLSLQAEYDDYIANAGHLSSLYADLHAELIAEWQAYWVMGQELTALNNSLDLNDDLIAAYGAADDLSDLAGDLAALQVDLADAIYDIEVAEQALADAQVHEAADEAYIAYYQALIVTLQQRHANTLAIAAKYKALMEAALAS
jgi:hypothetical protein